MRIGLYFGSFNPIHVGHIQVARYFKNINAFDVIWFVPSPLNTHQKQEEAIGNDGAHAGTQVFHPSACAFI